MCPCNLSIDHGATYDYRRVTLVFDITEGDVQGTDIWANGGDRRGRTEDHDRGQLATWCLRHDSASDEQFHKLLTVFT